MKSISDLPPLGKGSVRTAHRNVTDRLREAILSGNLRAGTHLVQAELARSLEVSVTPIREALRQLESEGLIDFDPFHGATVHEVSVEELHEVYELRSLVLPLAIRERVRSVSQAELDEAEEIVETMASTTSDERWIDLNRRLHQLLDGEPQKPHVRAVLRRLTDISALYVGVSVGVDPARRERAELDHRKIIDAYRREDTDQVIEIYLHHLKDTASVASRALTQKKGSQK